MASTVPDLNPRALAGLRLAVAGGGVLGLSIAVLAARSGARVSVFEPRALGDNASGVAAGMLSPAFEAALEAGGDYELFQQAYEAWPRFAEVLGLAALSEHRAGAVYLGDPSAMDRLGGRLEDIGVEFERLDAAAAQALQPALRAASREALYVQEDGRVDPLALLPALEERLREAGGELVAAPCPSLPTEGFDATILAAGYDTRRWLDIAPALAALQPIKGHVLHFHGGPSDGPTVRGEGGYAAPQPRGLIFGATMESGLADRALDDAAVQGLHTEALVLIPELAEVDFVARTGVRAATPDGRPLVGRVASGLHVATGARRNGWLLAPIIAAAALESLQGAAARSDFAPDRFRQAVNTN